jgi:hypothetical protein
MQSTLVQYLHAKRMLNSSIMIRKSTEQQITEDSLLVYLFKALAKEKA